MRRFRIAIARPIACLFLALSASVAVASNHVTELALVDLTDAGRVEVLAQLLIARADQPEATAPRLGQLESLTDITYAGDYWLTFSVKGLGTDDGRRFLQIENPRIGHTEIWLRDGSRWRPLSLESASLGMGEHLTGMPRVTVFLPPVNEPAQIAVRMNDTVSFVPRLHLLSNTEIRRLSKLSLFVGGTGFGMLLLLALYNFVLGRLTSDRRYLLLTAYLCAQLVFLLHYLGYADVLFWLDSTSVSQRLIVSTPFFVFATFLPLCLAMLKVPPQRWVRGYVALMCGLGLVFLVVEPGWLFTAGTLIGGVVSIAVHPYAFWLAFNGDRNAWRFIGFTSFGFVGGTTTWMEQLVGIGGGTVGHMLYLWGCVFTAILLAYALAAEIVSLRARSRYSENLAAAAQAEADSATQEARVKSAFLSTMSHEIRTPMNGVLGIADLLSRTDLSAEQTDYVSTITRSGRSLMAILDDILDYSKFESGNFVLEELDCDLLEIVDDAVLPARSALREKGVELHVDIAPEVPEVIVGDPTRLSQVIGNLLSNAVKFTDAGEVALEVRCHRNMLHLYVIDSGIGIDPSAQAGLFERFRQADSSVTRRYGGTGLGLAISRLIARALKGDVTVTSVAGEGATFNFWFPMRVKRRQRWPASVREIRLAGGTARQRRTVERFVSRWSIRVTEGAATLVDLSAALRFCSLRNVCCADPAISDAFAQKPLAGARVLVAEDNATNQIVARKTLASLGAEVALVADGAQAVAAFADGTFDLVLMDCEMPVLDGYSATEQIRDFEQATGRAPVAVIALSANATAEYRDRATAAGMDDYLAKPFRREALASVLAAHLKR